MTCFAFKSNFELPSFEKNVIFLPFRCNNGAYSVWLTSSILHFPRIWLQGELCMMNRLWGKQPQCSLIENCVHKGSRKLGICLFLCSAALLFTYQLLAAPMQNIKQKQHCSRLVSEKRQQISIPTKKTRHDMNGKIYIYILH